LEVPLRRRVAVQFDATDELARDALVRPTLRGRLTRAGDGGQQSEGDHHSRGERPLWPQQRPYVRATQRGPPLPISRACPGLVTSVTNITSVSVTCLDWLRSEGLPRL